jgi:hypothetical protein
MEGVIVKILEMSLVLCLTVPAKTIFRRRGVAGSQLPHIRAKSYFE